MSVWTAKPMLVPPEPGVGEALGADQRVVVVAALPAVLLREAEAEVAELAGRRMTSVGPEVSSHSLRWG